MEIFSDFINSRYCVGLSHCGFNFIENTECILMLIFLTYTLLKWQNLLPYFAYWTVYLKFMTVENSWYLPDEKNLLLNVFCRYLSHSAACIYLHYNATL